MLWENGDGSKLPADSLLRIERILEVLDSVRQVPDDFETFKNWNVHKLSGSYKNHWSLKVNKNYRIIFKFDGQDVFDIDYIDYN